MQLSAAHGGEKAWGDVEGLWLRWGEDHLIGYGMLAGHGLKATRI